MVLLPYLCEIEEVVKSLLVLATIAGALSAQPVVDEHKVRELLASPALIDRAWGAFWASRLAVPDAGKLLIDQLASLEPYSSMKSDDAEQAAIHAVFDGLIETSTQVPAERLIPFTQHWRDESLILLARQQGNANTLLPMLDERITEVQWTAINNLLLRERSEQFFARTLAELKVTHEFLVVDESTGGSAGGSGGGFVGCGVRRLPKDFPPIGLYQLTESPNEGDVLVVKGPRDVYYRRTIARTNAQVGWSSGGIVHDRQTDLLAYLAAWNGVNVDAAKQVFQPMTTIRWSGAGEFERAVQSALKTQQSAIRDFVATAKQKGAGNLNPVRLEIVSHLEDRRHGGEPSPAAIAANAVTIP